MKHRLNMPFTINKDHRETEWFDPFKKDSYWCPMLIAIPTWLEQVLRRYAEEECRDRNQEIEYIIKTYLTEKGVIPKLQERVKESRYHA